MRRNGAVVLAVLAVGGAVAVHHSDLATGGMDHHGAGATLELCLGVFAMVGAGVAAVTLGLLAPARLRPIRTVAAVGLSGAADAPHPRARPGPPLLSLLCVRRR